jgi:hypothetical protein
LAAVGSHSGGATALALAEQGAADEDIEGFAFQEPCETHRVLKLVFSTLKSGGGGSTAILKAANTFFDRNVALSTELLAMSRVWREGDFHLKALDELEMHKIKMRLALPGEVVDPGDELWKLQEEDVGLRRHELEVELRGHQHSFQESVSQLKYLRSLRQTNPAHTAPASAAPATSAPVASAPATSAPGGGGCGDGRPAGGVLNDGARDKQDGQPQVGGGGGEKGEQNGDHQINPICVVCHEDLPDERAILSCAHQFCSICVRTMLQRAASRFGGRVPVIKCPTCRKPSAAPQVKFVVPEIPQAVVPATRKQSDEQVAVAPTTSNPHSDPLRQERFGTKLDAVVGKLLDLEKQEPSAKVLVFSQWEQVMDILERALTQENLSFVRLQNLRKGFYERLDFFKRDPSIRVLLLPVKSGANGLNLTEVRNACCLGRRVLSCVCVCLFVVNVVIGTRASVGRCDCVHYICLVCRSVLGLGTRVYMSWDWHWDICGRVDNCN